MDLNQGGSVEQVWRGKDQVQVRVVAGLHQRFVGLVPPGPAVGTGREFPAWIRDAPSQAAGTLRSAADRA